MAGAAPWLLVIAAGIVLAEGWKPWSLIISGIMFVGWLLLISEFVSTRWRRYRDGRR
jgi:hypothetical protein